MAESTLIKDLMKELTVLCVDDEALALEYLGGQLASKIKNVIKASDGTEGLEAFRFSKPDLILTDKRMGYIEGIVMIKEI